MGTLGSLVVGARPAGAETTLSVGTPAGNLYRSGRPIPLVVTVNADQLVEGVLTVLHDNMPGGRSAERLNIEVPGGTSAKFLLITNPPSWSGPPQVTLTVGGKVVARGGQLQRSGDIEPVGVFPSFRNRDLPQRADLVIDAGEADLFDLDPAILDEGADALAVFTHVVATGADIDGLSEPAADSLLRWVDEGGRLLIDDRLPVAMGHVELGEDGRAPVGLGEVVLTDGAVSDGAIDGLFRPTSVTSTDELPFGQSWFPTVPMLARHAGVQTPDVAELLFVTGGYVLLVGPVLWFVLRRRRRERLVWVAVPAVAVLATSAVWVTGRQLRSEASGAHATVVVESPGATVAYSDVLLTSANGGDVGITLPAGWHQQSVGDDQGVDISSLGTPRADGNDLVADVPPGGFGVFRASGVVEPHHAWEVDAHLDDGDLVGTVTNRSDGEISEVYVFAGATHRRIADRLAAGETAEFELGAAAGALQIEGRFINEMFDRAQRGDIDAADSFNTGALATWLNRLGPQAYPSGLLTVVGWTNDEEAPLRTRADRSISAGSTAFVSRVPVVVGDAPLSAAAVRTELVRGPSQTTVSDAGVDRNDGPPVELALTLAMIPPAGSVPADGDVFLELPPPVRAADLWVDDAWEPLGRAATGDDLFAVPAGAFVDGVVYVRAGLSGDIWSQEISVPQMVTERPPERAPEAGKGLDPDVVTPPTTLGPTGTPAAPPAPDPAPSDDAEGAIDD